MAGYSGSAVFSYMRMSSSRSAFTFFRCLCPASCCQREGMVFSIDWTPSSTLTQVQFLRSRNNDKIVGILGPTNIQQSTCGTIQLTWNIAENMSSVDAIASLFHGNPVVQTDTRRQRPANSTHSDFVLHDSISPYILIFLTIKSDCRPIRAQPYVKEWIWRILVSFLFTYNGS